MGPLLPFGVGLRMTAMQRLLTSAVPVSTSALSCEADSQGPKVRIEVQPCRHRVDDSPALGAFGDCLPLIEVRREPATGQGWSVGMTSSSTIEACRGRLPLLQHRRR